MNFFKRVSLLLLAICLLAGTAGAYQAQDAGAHYLENVYTPGVCSDPARQAGLLHNLGLFRGTDRGFELESPLTRAQAAVLLTRLLGGEAAPAAHPFTDVPAWADAAVGWLYENGLTNGVGGGRYDSGRSIRYEEFAAMLVRALCGAGTDYSQWTRLGNEDEAQYWAQYDAFPRSAAVGLTVRALLQSPAPGADTLLQRLYAKGLFTAEALGREAYGVLPASYEVDTAGVLRRYVGGVAVARCAVTGLTLAEDCVEQPQDLLYAYKRESSGLAVYALACDTLAVVHQGRAPSADAVGLVQVGGLDAQAYLCELRPGGIYGALLGRDLTVYETAGELWRGEAVPRGDARLQCGQDGTLLALAGGTLRLRRGGEALALPWPENAQLLAYTQGLAVGKERLADGTLSLFTVDAATGGTLQTLRLPPRDFGRGPEPVDLARQENGCFTGSAGAYALGEAGLHCLTDLPTVDVTMTRMLWPYFLTYTPGVTPLAGDQQTGDAVYTLDNDGQTIPVLTGNHGVRFLRLTDYNTADGLAPDGTLCSYLVFQNYLGILSVQDERLPEGARDAAFQKEFQRLQTLGLIP